MFLTASIAGGCAAAEEAPAPQPAGFDEPLSVIEPGGDTVCSDGSPYRFAVLHGDPDKVVLDFAGGGACWNDWTCELGDAVFSTQAPSQEQFEAWVYDGQASGLYATLRDDNPVAGWTVVYVSYCTGDIHWGDAEVNHDGLLVQHRGRVNAEAVMSWVQERYEPSQILVNGASAGAYAAVAYLPRVVSMYPDADVSMLADSGAGVLTESFRAEGFGVWNAEGALPMHLPGLEGRVVSEIPIEDLYVAVAEAHPDVPMAQYHPAYDVRQSFYYLAMGGNDDWTDAMRSSMQNITASVDNFSYYIAPGPTHTITAYEHFYTRTTGADDVPYTAFLDDLVQGELPAPADCAPFCDQDPVCDACLDGSYAGDECRFCENW